MSDRVSSRRWTRRSVLAAGLLLAGQGLVAPPRAHAEARSATTAADVLEHAVAFLATQRTPSGLYPSRVYGLLRGGASTTPFVVLALESAGAISHEDVRTSLEALAARCDDRGALGLIEAAADYPCYSTGMMLAILASRREAASVDLAARARDWLFDQQLASARGWRDHPALGGWGIGSRRLPEPPHAGHVDLSMTRRVIEGLVASGVAPDHPALLEARSFVLRCQSEDGGFFYSPVEVALNKGHRDDAGASLGYGSATTDGWHALAALGRAEDEEARRAHRWLLEHHRVDANPGVEGGPMHAFAEAMRGYYRAGSATVFARAGGPDGWRDALVSAIRDEQNEDGSFANPNPLQKEDDPLIATGFAVVALAAALREAAAA